MKQYSSFWQWVLGLNNFNLNYENKLTVTRHDIVFSFGLTKALNQIIQSWLTSIYVIPYCWKTYSYILSHLTLKAASFDRWWNWEVMVHPGLHNLQFATCNWRISPWPPELHAWSCLCCLCMPSFKDAATLSRLVSNSWAQAILLP
jgi:hypothetical protein